ncbi:hypothetical protein B0W48_03345 [Pseudoalteromonas aliena]|uniref:Uncharacterized protein n=2 Tax=Pseudoalteromonas aliena TaxID=247523 RepID=A0A1Q2GUX0_9GAMM|nr:hypothetical protein B0W48_03345 [Pseudoalteromonas aliena]
MLCNKPLLNNKCKQLFKMEVSMKTAVLALMIMLLTACKTTNINTVLHHESSTQGIISGSMAWPIDGPVYNPLVFKLRSTDTGQEYSLEVRPSFNIFHGKTEVQFSSNGYGGTTYALALPSGEYEFYNYSMYDLNGTTWSSRNDYSIPFNVSANQTIYLGEIKLHVKSSTDFLGGDVYHGGFWTFADKHKRDLAILSKHQQNLFNENTLVNIPKNKRKFTDLVLLPSEKINHDESEK